MLDWLRGQDASKIANSAKLPCKQQSGKRTCWSRRVINRPFVRVLCDKSLPTLAAYALANTGCGKRLRSVLVPYSTVANAYLKDHSVSASGE